LLTRLLWIAAGLLPGVLFITALVMWWNRSLSKKRTQRVVHTEEKNLQHALKHTIVPVLLIFAVLATTISSDAQTAASATVLGRVVDSSGAAVPGASIQLTDEASQFVRRQLTNEEGEFSVTGLLPGAYRVSASKEGFRTSTVPNFNIEVAKSYVLNFTVAVGTVSELVEVTTAPSVELQTLDSTVGAVIEGESLLRMPAINRSAMTFFSLQPLVVPTRGQISLQAGQHVTGQVAGARADQSTFTLDGLNVSDITAGTNFYSAGAIDFNGPTPMIPVPADDIQEFRLSTTNTNATYHQSAGGQLNLISKRGSNDFHGAAYTYLQNDALNANRWEYNRSSIRRPPLHDTRFGASAGGPIVRNQTFIFGHYEGRHLPQTAAVTRLVPTDSLRQGLLRFVDGTGAVRIYDVKDFDPRGLGMSPVVADMWRRLPAGNNETLGDGLNTTGFLAPVDASLDMDFGAARIDHIFSDRWRLDVGYRYASQTAFGVSQVDIAGFAPGHVSGQAAPAARTNVQPRAFSVHLSANLTPNLLNDLTAGDARNFWADQRTTPRPQVPGTAGALNIAQNFLDQGLDVSSAARSRIWNNHNYQIRDNVSWLKGRHNVQFGGGWEHIKAFQQREDKIVGQLTALVYNLNARSGATVPQASRPVTCGAGVTTNCIQSASVAAWNDLFAGALGIVDNAGVIATRDSSLNPLPLTTPLRSHVHWENVDLYFNDVWRVNRSTTVTLGLNYSVQTPPSGSESNQAILVDQATGKALSARDVFSNRRAAAEQGQVWNPNLSWTPVGKGAPQGVYKTTWDNLSPRLAASWNPSYSSGLAGRLFGDQKTVLRGGYSLVFDRINGSTNVFFPMLNLAFAQTLTCIGPRTNGSCQTGSNPSTAFRIGVDGTTVPLSPQLPTSALVPPAGYTETSSSGLDPTLKPGYAHALNFTIQREAGKGFIVEAGYVGHFGRNLLQSVDLNAVPYFMKDAASNQTFAQAYDAVAQYLRSGGAAAAVAVQPWFENQLRAAAVCTTSCTAGLAATQNAAFTQGLLNTLFNVINTQRPAGPITNNQVLSLWMRTNGGQSSYNAGFLSVRRRFTNGLSLQANYTFSKSLDAHGFNQEAESLIASGYDFKLDYGLSAFDRTHVFNSNFFYDVPFGRGRRFGGWYVSGIYSANSGLPLTVVQSTSVFGGAPQVGSVAAGAIPLRTIENAEVHSNVAGANGVGTTGNPANRGAGLNIFADPAAVFSAFRPVLLSVDGRTGRNRVRGLSRWNLDLSVGKKTSVTERVSAVFTADFINALNHVEFVDPSLSVQTPASFGVITTQYGTPRAIQLALRLEF
jgi:Carboxypeptidase regulatory-like domain